MKTSEQIIRDAIDAAFASMQKDIGQTDGGNAGLFLDGEVRFKLVEIFEGYLYFEKLMEKR